MIDLALHFDLLLAVVVLLVFLSVVIKEIK